MFPPRPSPASRTHPKSAVFRTGLLPTLAPPGLTAAWPMALLVLHAALALVWLGGYTLPLARAGPVLGRPRVRRLLGRATGVALIGFGAMITVR